ncbi:MAG: hypothetical protein CL607_02070 [Anaerolineaceae bacterium]|nr:hypothetical protein [Anaerolineaceae bacterium]
MSQDHRPKDQSRQLIVDAILAAGGPLTRTQIARVLQRTKTPHLIALIDSLVEEGYLARSIVTFKNGVQGYQYDLSEELRRALE